MLFYSGTLFHGFQTLDPRGQPGFMLYVQTFGDLVTFNPHIHALVADGVFYHSGTFRVLPPIPEDALRKGLRHWVLDHLCKEAGFDPEPAKQRLLTCGSTWWCITTQSACIRRLGIQHRRITKKRLTKCPEFVDHYRVEFRN